MLQNDSLTNENIELDIKVRNLENENASLKDEILELMQSRKKSKKTENEELYKQQQNENTISCLVKF
jgi:hypothetical protein